MKKAGIILAGGKSSRFGTNKAITMFQDKTMLMHSVDLLRKFSDQILISGYREEYAGLGIPCIKDEYPGIGPIGGICTALAASPVDVNIIVTCDMPLVTPDMIARLLLEHRPGKITTFEREGNDIYPFPGIYEKIHLPVLREQIRSHDYLIRNVIEKVGGNPVSLHQSEKQCMSNINTQDDLTILNDKTD